MATAEGKLNDLHRELLGLGAERFISMGRGSPKPVNLASVPVPSGKLVEKATKYAYDNLDECVFNHSLRTFFFGAIIGADQFPDWHWDPEPFYLGSVLHDLGLTEKAIDNTVMSFELNGALLSHEFLQSNGAEKKTREIVFEAIARHTDLYIDGKTPEAKLVAMGASLDVGGFYAPLIHEQCLLDVVAKYPLLDLPKRAAELMEHEVKTRNNQCHIQCYMEMGLSQMIENNPLLATLNR